MSKLVWTQRVPRLGDIPDEYAEHAGRIYKIWYGAHIDRFYLDTGDVNDLWNGVPRINGRIGTYKTKTAAKTQAARFVRRIKGDQE